jgi:transcriptional regulator with XRE-family HTH domain
VSSLAPRTRLYRLLPAGLGTPMVEALSSYVMRLAAAHHLSVSGLIRAAAPELVPPSIANTGNTGDLARAGGVANRMGRYAGAWSEAFGRATGRDDLAKLNFLAWSDLLSPIRLFRETMAHCTACLDEMASVGLVYEPILWTMRAVVACPAHGQLLQVLCPKCGRSQPPLHLWARPGICRLCRRWLVGPGPSLRASTAELARSQLIAEIVGHPPSPQDRDQTQLRTSIEAALVSIGQTAKDFATRADVPAASLSNWRHGRSRPSLDGVLAMCAVGAWNPAAFLCGTLAPRKSEAILAANPRRLRRRIDWATTRTHVLGRLSDEPPATLKAVAKDLSVDARWLGLHLPAETELLRDRYALWAKDRVARRRARIRELVTDATLGLLEQFGRATRREVEGRLPSEIQVRERIVWRTWQEVRARWAANQTPT